MKYEFVDFKGCKPENLEETDSIVDVIRKTDEEMKKHKFCLFDEIKGLPVTKILSIKGKIYSVSCRPDRDVIIFSDFNTAMDTLCKIDRCYRHPTPMKLVIKEVLEVGLCGI